LYLGHLRRIKASELNLWQLTEWHPANHYFNTIHETPHSRLLVHRRWVEWCEEEAQRIGRDPQRKAAVVERNNSIAVFVDRVAWDDDEHSDGNDEV
jgi:hypothetical protein